jgi:hypothetical protein
VDRPEIMILMSGTFFFFSFLKAMIGISVKDATFLLLISFLYHKVISLENRYVKKR